MICFCTRSSATAPTNKKENKMPFISEAVSAIKSRLWSFHLQAKNKKLDRRACALKQYFHFGFLRYIIGDLLADSELVALCISSSCSCNHKNTIKLISYSVC